MMTDKLIAAICLVGFFAFLLVSAVYIKEFDLIIVIAVTLALVTFDFWKTLFRRDSGNKGGS